jgi:AraC-like DNA-binding protein
LRSSSRSASNSEAIRLNPKSEAAFNRSFKKYVGTPPGAWRKGRIPEDRPRVEHLSTP